MLTHYFADLHIHIGRDINNKPVKITASKNLTLTNILIEASRKKGIAMVGVIDSQSPAVQKEIRNLIERNKAYELPDGGIRFEEVTLILGSEIEVYDEHCHGPIHVLCFFPTLQMIDKFTTYLSTRMKNITLSSQRYYGSAKELQHKVKELQGLFIPAHVFTPFKSLYGKGVRQSLVEVFDPDLIDAIELGLSSDTHMAEHIKELRHYSFLTNSDAHSLAKIGREYQQILMKEPSFTELELAIHEVADRQITVNYGMNPRLGKYYTTVCNECMQQVTLETNECPNCHSKKMTQGVYDRIMQLAHKHDDEIKRKRPPYMYQIPLEYLPKLGPKTLTKLLHAFGTEMNVIHHVPFSDLVNVIPEKMAQLIIDMRLGKQRIAPGGGGKYGKIIEE